MSMHGPGCWLGRGQACITMQYKCRRASVSCYCVPDIPGMMTQHNGHASCQAECPSSVLES